MRCFLKNLNILRIIYNKAQLDFSVFNRDTGVEEISIIMNQYEKLKNSIDKMFPDHNKISFEKETSKFEQDGTVFSFYKSVIDIVVCVYKDKTFLGEFYVLTKVINRQIESGNLNYVLNYYFSNEKYDKFLEDVPT